MRLTQHFHRNAEPHVNACFVFESSQAHRWPGAQLRLAQERFGASPGLMGNSNLCAFGIVCTDANRAPLPLTLIKEQVNGFLSLAQANANIQFHVAQIGKDSGAFPGKAIAPCFAHAPRNVCLPLAWKQHVLHARQIELPL